MKMTRIPMIPLLLLCLVTLGACEQRNAETAAESIRPIKTITLASKVMAVDQRHFPGLVQASSSSVLSFEVSGKVFEVAVEVGDQVTRGQSLVMMDDESFRLSVLSHEANLEKAKVDFRNRAADYDRKRELADKGYVSTSELDQALAQRDAADNLITMARSQLSIAQRDLRNTVLSSPLNGFVSRRLIEPHQEVAAGQELIQIDVLNELEVELMLPENIIGLLNRGDIGEVVFAGLRNISVQGIVNEIGTHAESANAFPVSLRLSERPKGLFPGMTAEVSLSIGQGDNAAGFLLPAPAVIAGVGKGPGDHYVYVYQPETATVRKVQVKVSGGQGNMARVSAGLKAGDIVAVAGASFLSDGQRVHLLEDVAGSNLPVN